MAVLVVIGVMAVATYVLPQRVVDRERVTMTACSITC
jgi:hypothetical protein